MTEILYQTDSYLREFNAEVCQVLPEMNAFILDRTAFYPGGGGQSYDTGSVIFNGLESRLKRAKMDPLGLLHIVEDGESLPDIGSIVTGQIDWERRYQIMRTHTAMHILCGVIFRDYGALVTGGDMEPLKGRMDFEFETLTKELIAIIEKSVNAEVDAAHNVKVAILPREEAFKIPDLIRTKINLLPDHIQQVRTVEIVDLDLQADGGTHVNNTSEVRKMRTPDYKSKGKINKRIYLELSV